MQESREVSLSPAGDQKAAMNRINNTTDPQKKDHLGMVK